MDKPVLMVSKSPSEDPFDIKSKTIILYNDVMDLSERLTNSLARLLIHKN
ncbi:MULTISPECIES: hypothetical protein [Brevibacillus]